MTLNYDQWKLASPPEIEMPDCGNCDHSFDDHGDDACIEGGRCPNYFPNDYEPEEPDRYSERRERRLNND